MFSLTKWLHRKEKLPGPFPYKHYFVSYDIVLVEIGKYTFLLETGHSIRKNGVYGPHVYIKMVNPKKWQYGEYYLQGAVVHLRPGDNILEIVRYINNLHNALKVHYSSYAKISDDLQGNLNSYLNQTDNLEVIKIANV